MKSSSFRLVAFSLHVIVMFSIITISSARLAPNGANVCSRSVSFQDNYQQSYQVSYKYRYTTSCGILGWGRCTRYRTAYRTKYRIATVISYRKQYFCCKGWSQEGNQCTKAICTQPCVNGTCTKPDNCSCNSGYYGQFCERDCPSHKWGPHCRNDCLCQNNAKCSSHTGTCTCTPGWEGQYCNTSCDQGFYGNKCQYNCTCPNGGKCDPVNGDCACAKGYQGRRCESKCPRGWYGQDCTMECACLNGAPCDHVTGTCNCTAGWTGENCDQKCAEGTYGYRCAQICRDCMHGATCNHVTGVCDCRPGYKGERCENVCDDGTFGQGCQDICECHNNATCSHLNGSCMCNPGYTGEHCEHHSEIVDLSNLGHEKHTSATSATLVPSTTACAALFVIVAAVLAYKFYRKKKKSHRLKTPNRPSEPIYASAERPPPSSGHEETTEITDVDTETSAEAIHVYHTPTARSTNTDGNSIAMGKHYMDLSSQRSLDSNTYESLNTQTLKSNQIKVAVYDVPVTKKKTNAYEEIKLNNNSSDKDHYYKGLERPSTSRAHDVNGVAMETKPAEQSIVDVGENHYDTPDSKNVTTRRLEEEASGYASPR